MSNLKEHQYHVHHEHSSDENSLKDPVCGMTVNNQSKYSYSLKDIVYYFCSNSCKEKFISLPAKYLDKDACAIGVAKPLAGTIYTCPMHPQIQKDHQGNCPICGMSLEPLIPGLAEEANPELLSFQRRFWWTLPLTTVVTTLAMFGHELNLMTIRTQTWVELVLSLPIVLWAGWPFFQRGFESVVNRSPNMWTLIGLGTSAAFIYSVVATIAPQLFPASFISMGRVSVYFEAAAVIISLTLLGQLLELKARSQTSAAIKSLLGLAPMTARRIKDDGTEEDIPLALSLIHI